jgi:catechol 2,3-dioxygenase-like lactoylglutathione lyase family enzyme
MLTAIDHVIIGVNDLERAAALFRERLGLSVSGGGEHPTGGTANRIIVLEETYLELITVHAPAEAQRSMLDRLAQGEGYLNFAIASDDILADTAAMRARGVPVLGPAHGELRSAEGRSRSWLRADIERPDLTQHYPFLIQHDSSGEERRFRLAGWQQPPRHRLGQVRVLSVTIAVADLPEATQRFRQIYGLEPLPPFSGEADHWEALLTAFPLANGSQRFELAAPLSLASPSSAPAESEAAAAILLEPGGLSWYLRTFGESLCRMTLAVESMTMARRYLDEQQVSYTYQERPQPVLWIHPRHSCGAAIMLRPWT